MSILRWFLVFSLIQASNTFSCTAFHWKSSEGSFVGKSYDWHHSSAYLINNKRGVKKKGFSAVPWESGPAWISRFGSLTFNQYGREFPNGGMNEAGLTVEVLWLNRSEYEASDNRPVLNQLTWVQYQLDNFSTVNEVIAALSENRLSPIQGKIHYFVCDETSNCAVIEWLKGTAVVHSGSELNPKAITNNSYEESLQNYKKINLSSNSETADSSIDESSLARFNRIAKLIESKEATLNGTFELLNEVAMANLTTWQIAYDFQNRSIQYRTRSNQNLRQVQLKDFDFDCANEPLMLNIEEGSGDVVTRFTQFDYDKNYELLQDSLSEISFSWVLVPMLNRYPSTTSCASDLRSSRGQK
jgi:choloylglycine hydrolase